MLKNYLTVALRNLLRHKGYSLINVLGLAIGIACCLLILLYVQDELSYDRYHKKADRIYRLVMKVKLPFLEAHTARSMPLMGPNLCEEYPEVVDYVRFKPPILTWMVNYQDRKFNEARFVFADNSIFKVFTLPLIQGDPETVLSEPYTVVISEEIAHKFFGDEDPMGKVVNVDNFKDFRITGVMRNMPRNSHVRYDLLPSFISLREMYGAWFVESTSGAEFYTYLLLQEGASTAALEEKLPAFVARHYGHLKYIKNLGEQLVLSLQPLTDIHLRSHLEHEAAPNNDITTVYTLSVIAVFVLLIACINFMNLATARAAYRTREVGLRKVVGAHRLQLMGQFLGESILFAALALLLAILFVHLSLPAFSALAGKTLALDYTDAGLWVGVLGITLLVGILAGSYPAFLLSAFQPTRALKGTIGDGSKGTLFRKILVVGQFAISVALIIGTMIVHDQMGFLQKKDLGFDKEQMVLLRVTYSLPQYETLKSTYLAHPNVVAVTASNNIPGGVGHTEPPWGPIGLIEGAAGEKPQLFETWQLYADYDFIETYGIELVEGRNFSHEFGADPLFSLILNEAAVKQLGWESAAGKYFPLGRDSTGQVRGRQVIGVVKDFHTRSLHHKIEPVAISLATQAGVGIISVRIRPNDMPNTIAFLEQTWREIAPEWAFQYSFLDDDFARHYHTEETISQLSSYFAFLAVFVGCLGLFGLASFTAQKRTKEMGIRKTFGVSISSLALLLVKEFLLLVLVANVIAWPVIYFAMDRWLQDFAYRIDISWVSFVLAGVLALVIALVTVSYQAVKAALTNPVDTLRYE